PGDRYDVRRLGEDPRFPYDTYGGVDANAQILTDEIRTVGRDYSAVNIVSHSMGGVVTDQAFANGLSASDGVRTFVAIAGPHSGADYARAPAFLLPILVPVEDIARSPRSDHPSGGADPVGPGDAVVATVPAGGDTWRGLSVPRPVGPLLPARDR